MLLAREGERVVADGRIRDGLAAVSDGGGVRRRLTLAALLVLAAVLALAGPLASEALAQGTPADRGRRRTRKPRS